MLKVKLLVKNYIILFLFLGLVFSCDNANEVSEITESNLLEKIDEARKAVEKDDFSKLIPVLFYIEENNVVFKDVCVEAKVYSLKANRYFSLKENVNILSAIEKTLTTSLKCNDNKLISEAYNLLSIYYFRNPTKKDYLDLTIKNLELAVAYGKKVGNNFFLIDAYYNLSDSYQLQKEWEKLKEYSENGIEYIKANDKNSTRLKYFHIFLANAQTNLGEYDAAEKNLETAKSLYKNDTQENKYDLAKFYRELYLSYANLYRYKNDLKSTYNYFKKADSLVNVKNSFFLNEVNDLIEKEIELQENLLSARKEIIFKQNLILVISIIFLLLISIILFYNIKISKKLKLSILEKEKLNKKLKSTNRELSKKNKEINTLLQQKEQFLFTKTLKISTYKDAIRSVINSNEKLVEDKATINSIKVLLINKTLENIISDTEIWEDFKIDFESNRPNFFNNLLAKEPSLSVLEQKHCAYLAIDLSSKEVSSLINVSPRSVETTRYRIKKKLQIDENLSDFLKSL